jgi:hypothetical protein
MPALLLLALLLLLLLDSTVVVVREGEAAGLATLIWLFML